MTNQTQLQIASNEIPADLLRMLARDMVDGLAEYGPENENGVFPVIGYSKPQWAMTFVDDDQPIIQCGYGRFDFELLGV